MASASATVSAPGKVLLAGGYLILDQEHAGTVRQPPHLMKQTLFAPIINLPPLPPSQVLALDARFYSNVEIIQFSDDAAKRQAIGRGGEAQLLIEVQSPQFQDVRRYRYEDQGSDVASAELVLLPSVSNGKTPSNNRYVEVPLLYCLTLLRELHGGCGARAFFDAAVARACGSGELQVAQGGGIVGLRMTIAADNGFYSQAGELNARGWPLSADSLRKLPRMLPPRKDASGELAKTGLGSSATLVTSLLGALLHLFGAIELPSRSGDGARNGGAAGGAGPLRGEAGLQLLHSLSQLCHCAAQGKVGSGFDVCSAVYGSHVYTRFSPQTIAALLALPVGQAPLASDLCKCVGAPSAGGAATVWDHVVSPFALPPGIEVVMADVSCGANTPSMVKKVLAWRKASSAAADLWSTYAAASVSLQGALQALCQLHEKISKGGAGGGSAGGEWTKALAKCGSADPATWSHALGEVGAALACVRAGCIKLRGLLRQISDAAETPIEPPEQTYLLDATMEVRGVLMAVVPGAGGNDAVIALILPSDGDGQSGAAGTRARVAAKWREWPEQAPPPAPSVVCELLVVESRQAAAGHNGVLLEGADATRTLRSAREGGGGGASLPVRADSPVPPKFRLLRVLTRTDVAHAEEEFRSRMLTVLAATVVVGAVAAACLRFAASRAK